jgi:ABC-type transport system involved in multi-copper enzyme maturation permease subunit
MRYFWNWILTGVDMKNIITLSKITIRENLAKNMVAANLFYVLVLVFFAAFVQDIPDENGKLEFFLDGGFLFLSLFTLFFSVACTFPSVESDISSNRIHVYLSGYFSRREYLTGKYLGAVFSVTLNYLILCAALSLACYLTFSTHPGYIFFQYMAGMLEYILIIGLILFFSLSMSRFMALMSMAFFYVLAHFTYYLKYYLTTIDSSVARWVEYGYFLLPNLEYFGIKNALFSGKALGVEYWGLVVLYTLGWLLVTGIATELVFCKKEY